MQHFFEQVFFGNRVIDYLIFLLILAVGIIGAEIIKKTCLKKMKVWAGKTNNKFDDLLVTLIEKNILPLLAFGSFYLGVQGLKLYPLLKKIIDIGVIALLTFFGVRFLMEIIVYLLEHFWLDRENDSSRKQALRGIITVVKFSFWGLALIIILDNLGVKITALVAGLGIGGIAVALAAQAVLGDLFSYFTIFFDRPFEIGDFIIVDNFAGAVEYIGIKTTRLRSLGGEQLVFSNTDLTNSRVRNYKRMDRRRVLFSLGVTYDTSLELLKEIPEIITAIIKEIPNTVFDRAHFQAYGDFSLKYEVVYYVLGSDYNLYMDIQQEINFRLKEEFEKRGIEFAFPTQTLYVSS